MLLTELSISCLAVVWWRHTLQTFNRLVATPPQSLFHASLLDNQHDAFQRGTRNFCKSIFEGLASSGYSMSRSTTVATTLDIDAIMDLFQGQLQGSPVFALHCPRPAPSRGVVSCTCHQWFHAFSKRRRNCHQPASGRRMHAFLSYRLGCHALPIVAGCFAGGQHADRAHRVCSHCDGEPIGGELHMVLECSALQPLRQQYSSLFASDSDTMRSLLGRRTTCSSSIVHWTVLIFARMIRFL